MIGKTNSGGSGIGNLLNVFSASAVPESGKAGQIVVISDDACNYYEYGSTAPESRANGDPLENGDVFLQAGSTGSLNILKRKNAIKLGFDGAYRRSAESWIRAKASYYDSAWHQFSDERLYLIRDGSVNTDVITSWKTGSNTFRTGTVGYLQPTWVNGVAEIISANAIQTGSYANLYIDFNGYKDTDGNYLIANNGSGYTGQFLIGVNSDDSWGTTAYTSKLSYGYNYSAPPQQRSTVAVDLTGIESFYLKLTTSYSFPQIFNIYLG